MAPHFGRQGEAAYPPKLDFFFCQIFQSPASAAHTPRWCGGGSRALPPFALSPGTRCCPGAAPPRGEAAPLLPAAPGDPAVPPGSPPPSPPPISPRRGGEAPCGSACSLPGGGPGRLPASPRGSAIGQRAREAGPPRPWRRTVSAGGARAASAGRGLRRRGPGAFPPPARAEGSGALRGAGRCGARGSDGHGGGKPGPAPAGTPGSGGRGRGARLGGNRGCGGCPGLSSSSSSRSPGRRPGRAARAGCGRCPRRGPAGGVRGVMVGGGVACALHTGRGGQVGAHRHEF